MFCKYCGGNLNAGETKCKRCGKEVPVTSDCGGFYDLVQTEKPDVPNAVSAPQKVRLPAGLIIAVAAGFVVLAVIIGILAAGQNRLEAELDALSDDLEEIAEQQATDPTQTQTEEEQVEDEPTEETQDIIITLPPLTGKTDEEVQDTTVSEA